MVNDEPVGSDGPAPRLCHLRMRSDFEGYGFNLHADKDKVGQYIGKVDANSPAKMAGLKEGDRVIEVNGVNVCNENHQQIIERIKSKEKETTFLVLQPEEDAFYREKEIVVHSNFPNVIRLETPLRTNKEQQDEGIFSDDVKAHFHKLRSCHLNIWPDFQGYGFNLHVLKDTNKQHIGKVDKGSPAEAGGLKENDRLVEVNGKSIAESTHDQVVKMVKEHTNHVQMLVVDEETYEFLNSKGVKISGDLPGVVHIHCPDKDQPTTNGIHVEHAEVHTLNEEIKEAVKEDAHLEEKYKLRFCHIFSWNDGQGFGFNMQSEKGKPGQYITKVDADSPAELGGLKLGDRLIAVNSTVVLDKNHADVVKLIKENLAEANILVANSEDFKSLEEKGVDVSKADEKYVTHIYCPKEKPTKKDEIKEKAAKGTKEEPKPEDKNKKDNKKKADKEVPSPAAPTSPPTSPSLGDSQALTDVLLFAATAEEARKRMAKKKAAENMSLKDKYEMFKKL